MFAHLSAVNGLTAYADALADVEGHVLPVGGQVDQITRVLPSNSSVGDGIGDGNGGGVGGRGGDRGRRETAEWLRCAQRPTTCVWQHR